MANKIKVLRLKDKSKLGEFYQLLAKHGIEVKDAIKSFKEEKPIYIDLKQLTDSSSFLEKISEFVEYEVEENQQPNLDGWGTALLLTLDISLFLVITEIAFKLLEVYDTILYIVQNIKVASLSVFFLKLFYLFIFIRGSLSLSGSTVLGKVFRLELEGNRKNFILFNLIPIIGFYMIIYNYAKFMDFVGLFLITFWYIAMIIAKKNLGFWFRYS